MNKDLAQVWHCGGGTQSCAIAALIIEGVLPKPDYSLIADTGREAGTTWSYLDLVLRPALSKVGVEIWRVKAADLGYAKEALFTEKGELLPPMFTTESGATGKLTNFCNRWWKQDSMQRHMSSKGLTRSKYRSWIGFSFDEQKRYFRMMEGEDYKRGLYWFPLVEKRLRRHESIEIVKAMGWPDPPRSRCWMCPNQSDNEWREIKENSPAEFAAAIAVEKEIQARDPNAWLHKSCVPIGEVDFTAPADLFNRACDSGDCFV